MYSLLLYFNSKYFLYFTVEEAHSLVYSSLNEAVMQVGGLKETCQELILYLPDGQFKEAITEALHGVYWLSMAFRSLEPIIGMGQKVALSDFFDSHEPKRKKPSAASGTPATQVTDIGGSY